jgi:hypothetical protein
MRLSEGSLLANAAVALALLSAWAICVAQLASAYAVWSTGAGIYGLPGGLATLLYGPVLVIYFVAFPFATHRWPKLMAAAPLLGTVGLAFA